MATKRNVIAKPNWKGVVFGAVVFVGLGLALLTAYQAGADDQMDYIQSTTVDGR